MPNMHILVNKQCQCLDLLHNAQMTETKEHNTEIPFVCICVYKRKYDLHLHTK